jgi:hypothetical protein
MRRCLGLNFLTFVFCVCGYSLAGNAQETKPEAGERQVITRAGEYVSPNGTCKAVLNISSLGGFLELTLQKDKNKSATIKDVTGIAWFGNEKLVYTTSPMYGTPGVYAYSCESNRVKRIVTARNVNKAYPDGADYFELRNISNTTPIVVFFYYAPDVDKADFENFRSPHYLYQVHLNGADFKKTE